MPYVLLITVVMAGLAWYLSGVVRQTYLDDLRAKLASQAQMIADVSVSRWRSVWGNRSIPSRSRVMVGSSGRA
jgi:hypothetical protein